MTSVRGLPPIPGSEATTTAVNFYFFRFWEGRLACGEQQNCDLTEWVNTDISNEFSIEVSKPKKYLNIMSEWDVARLTDMFTCVFRKNSSVSFYVSIHICKSKRHNQIFIMSSRSIENGLPIISLPNSNQMISIASSFVKIFAPCSR